MSVRGPGRAREWTPGEEKGERERAREKRETRETFAASGLSARKRSGWRTRFYERKDADDVADGPSNKDNNDDLAGSRLSPAECAASRPNVVATVAFDERFRRRFNVVVEEKRFSFANQGRADRKSRRARVKASHQRRYHLSVDETP